MTFYHSSLSGNHHKLAAQRFDIWSSISRTVWILFGLFSWMALRLNTFIPYIIGLHTHDMSQNVLQLLLPEKNISSSRCFSRFTIVLSRISVLWLGLSSMALNFVVLCLCVCLYKIPYDQILFKKVPHSARLTSRRNVLSIHGLVSEQMGIWNRLYPRNGMILKNWGTSVPYYKASFE